MSVRSFVGFVAKFPAVHNGMDPPGKELVTFLVEQLRNADFESNVLGDREGWAWDFFTKHENFEISTMVGFVGDMNTTPPRQWLITNEIDVGLLKRLFGGKALAEKQEQFLRSFCDALHHIISADSRFSHILWYNRDTFDEEGDQPGTLP